MRPEPPAAEPPVRAQVTSPRARALTGVLLGTALGDSLGLPMEGLSARRQARLFPGPVRQRLLAGRGLVSDDTEHTIMVAQALLEAPRRAADFQRVLARRLRRWLLCLPAGVGSATLRSILKLWLGVGPARSGVFSAGNGPAMRSALIGVFFADDPVRRREFVEAGAVLTHRDPRATVAALAVAETAAWMVTPLRKTAELHERWRSLSGDAEWTGIVARLVSAEQERQTAGDLARSLGARGQISGYAFQSVPFAIHAARRHQDDFSAAISTAISAGGDTDTVAAIVGGLVGAHVGEEAMPAPWLARLSDWPHSTRLLRRLAERLHEQAGAADPLGPVPYARAGIPLRNLFFLGLVLAHGFRRLLPPY